MNQQILEEFENALSAPQVEQSTQKISEACLDYFGHYQGNATALLYPKNTEQVLAVVQICNKHTVPLTIQGGKTGLVAGSVPAEGSEGVILSLRNFKSIRELDVANRSVVVEAGVTIKELNQHLASSHLHLPISIGSDEQCQIGGVISTNAGGYNVLRHGMTRRHLLGLEAVLPDGRLISNLRALRKDNVGYDFAQLLCGAEGTLGIVTAAALQVFPVPQTRVTALLAMQDINKVIEVYTALSNNLSDFLCAFELIPAFGRELVEKHIKTGSPPPIESAAWYVLVEAETSAQNLPLETLVTQCLAPFMDSGAITDAVIAQSETQRAQTWKFRESIVFAQNRHGPTLTHDLSVRVSRIPELLAQGRKAVLRIFPDVSFMTFGHVGDGNLHFNVVHNGLNPDYKNTYGNEIETALCEVVQELGGSVSAEHGIGRKKRALVHYSRDDHSVNLMKSTRRLVDPNQILNADVLC